MKKILFTFIILYSCTLAAQKSLFPQQMEPQPTTTNDSILNELRIIRGIQQESKHKRDSIIKARKNHILPSDEKPEDEYDAMAQIADNTRQNWVKDDWNVYGWVAFFIGFLTLIVGGTTLWAQWRTEKNTSKLNMEEQKALLADMIRHFYRNFVVSLTLRVKLEAGKRKISKTSNVKNYTGYPSEEHLKKMMVNLNDIHLNLFYKENKNYQLMNKLYVMLRNYNIELDVICNHLKSQAIDYTTKSRDLQTLSFKCYYLTKEITKLIGCIWYKGDNDYVSNAQKRILDEQEKNRKDNADETKHYKGKFALNVPTNSYYLNTLFCDERESFLNDLKKDIQIEAGLNMSGTSKIHIIKFQNTLLDNNLLYNG